jgi:hypothetical protein
LQLGLTAVLYGYRYFLPRDYFYRVVEARLERIRPETERVSRFDNSPVAMPLPASLLMRLPGSFSGVVFAIWELHIDITKTRYTIY